MFNFNKKSEKPESPTGVNDSLDYANYLLEVQESKASVLRELQEAGKPALIA